MSSRVKKLKIIKALRKWSNLDLKLQNMFLRINVYFIGSLHEINVQLGSYMYLLVGIFSKTT
jgi:hypothetical protein